MAREAAPGLPVERIPAIAMLIQRRVEYVLLPKTYVWNAFRILDMVHKAEQAGCSPHELRVIYASAVEVYPKARDKSS